MLRATDKITALLLPLIRGRFERDKKGGKRMNPTASRIRKMILLQYAKEHQAPESDSWTMDIVA